jgi:glyoxylate utilization-related uncharacterized protein
MNKNDNLKPVRSKKEARERGRKGGIASGEKRRELKTIKEMLESILSGNMTVKEAGEEKKLPKFQVLMLELCSMALSNKSKPKDKLHAMEIIFDRKEGKPSQNTYITSDGSMQPKTIIANKQELFEALQEIESVIEVKEEKTKAETNGKGRA